MPKLLLLNLFLMLLWPALIQSFERQDFVAGFLIGFVLLTIIERSYGRRIWLGASFLLFLLREIVISNINLAALILHFGKLDDRLDPGIVGIPLTAASELEITLLASVITLTPGTLSVDMIEDAQGHKTLYVHNLRVGDPEVFRASIKNGFERRLLQITRGAG